MTKLVVNGQPHQIEADPDMPLLWALRDHAGLTGTKYGCGGGFCGACTVHLDDAPARSCQIPLRAAEGRRIVTIEGADTPVAQAVKAAWQKLEVVQCGYCQPGQIMSAIGLLAANPNPASDAIDQAMHGNLCRCGTYQRIRAAVRDAARSLA